MKEPDDDDAVTVFEAVKAWRNANAATAVTPYLGTADGACFSRMK